MFRLKHWFDVRRSSTMKRNGMLCVMLTITSVLLSACSGTPSESDGRAFFENHWKEAIQNGTVKVSSFKKVNGQSGEMMGIKFYRLAYEAKIEYPKGLNTRCLESNPPLECIVGVVKVRSIGQKEVIKEEITFEKTEKGWKAEGGH